MQVPLLTPDLQYRLRENAVEDVIAAETGQFLPEVTSDALTAEQPTAALLAEQMKQNAEWFMLTTLPDGTLQAYTQPELAQLKPMLQSGEITAAHPVHLFAYNEATKEWSDETGTLQAVINNHFELGVMFSPVWEYAVAGLKWGAITGIGLKLLDSLILLIEVQNPMFIILVFLAAIFVFQRHIGSTIVSAASFGVGYAFGISPFAMLFGVVVAGTILGILPGMFIGAITGLLRRNSIPRAFNAAPESNAFVFTLLLGSLGGSIIILYLYIAVFMPWLVTVLNAA